MELRTIHRQEGADRQAFIAALGEEPKPHPKPCKAEPASLCRGGSCRSGRASGSKPLPTLHEARVWCQRGRSYHTILQGAKPLTFPPKPSTHILCLCQESRRGSGQQPETRRAAREPVEIEGKGQMGGIWISLFRLRDPPSQRKPSHPIRMEGGAEPCRASFHQSRQPPARTRSLLGAVPCPSGIGTQKGRPGAIELSCLATFDSVPSNSPV